MSLAGKFSDFGSVQQKFSLSALIVVHAIRFEVFLDIATHQPNLAFLYTSVRLFKRHMPIAKALDLASVEHYATLHRIQNMVAMPRLPVFRDNLLVGVL